MVGKVDGIGAILVGLKLPFPMNSRHEVIDRALTLSISPIPGPTDLELTFIFSVLAVEVRHDIITSKLPTDLCVSLWIFSSFVMHYICPT